MLPSLGIVSLPVLLHQSLLSMCPLLQTILSSERTHCNSFFKSGCTAVYRIIPYIIMSSHSSLLQLLECHRCSPHPPFSPSRRRVPLPCVGRRGRGPPAAISSVHPLPHCTSRTFFSSAAYTSDLYSAVILNCFFSTVVVLNALPFTVFALTFCIFLAVDLRYAVAYQGLDAFCVPSPM